jgi:predicted ATPase|tara:strand:+ start:1556 stop:2599 length:1044 start_codon:yes stop_codon:yes gene_type:complete
MNNDEIEKIYNDFVINQFINYDDRQEKLLKEINLTWKENKKINFFSSLKKFNGVYVHGSVGIGKTFILNLFSQNIKKSKKIHFNHFMINLHAFINNSNKKDAVETYIKEIGKNFDLLFIDELHIFNIVDALLIKKIFILFKKYNIFILVSSNFKPYDLYKNGLQRNDFIPFINFINENFQIINLQNMKDYRREMLNQSKTYFTPINEKTSREFVKLFERFVHQSQIHIRKIKTKSRDIRFEKCTANIVFCSFKELCATNLAHEDYHNVAIAFKLIFISNIPIFKDNISDQCRRFISLIDMLYDQQCSVVLLAEQPVNKLCQIKGLHKEFERTASRLYEMTIINSKKK